MAMFLIRYGELALKSRPVRQRFQKRLIDNIHLHFMRNQMECRTGSDHGRVYLWADNEEQASQILRRVFGIVSFSKVIETTSDHGRICETAAEYSKPIFDRVDGSSFAIRARRTGEHPYTSQTLARDVGSAVYYANEHHTPKVDLTDPEIEIFVEVRQNKCYIFSEKENGPGGMPLGSQGKVLAFIEKERDIAAAWLMMKRGCKVIFAASDESLVSDLDKWDPSLKLVDSFDDDVPSLVELAIHKKLEGLVLGWEVDDVIKDAVSRQLPVFYPLVALSNDEIDAIIKRIKSA